MVVLGDQYALLSLLWSDALGLAIEKTGVLVKPHEVRRWLDAVFVQDQEGAQEAGKALLSKAGLTDGELHAVHRQPFETLVKTLGPAFISITRMCNPPEAETASVVSVGDDDMQAAFSKEHKGFSTWRVKAVQVTAGLPMEHVVRMTHEAMREALDKREDA